LRGKASKKFKNEAYENIYVKNRFHRKMYRMINRSEVSTDKKYTYSGLTFLIFPEVVSQITGMPYEDYMAQEFTNHLV